MVHARFVEVHREKLRKQFAEQADITKILEARKHALGQSAFLPSDRDELAMQKIAHAIAKDQGWDFRGDTAEGLKLQEELIHLVTAAVKVARRDVIDELEGCSSRLIPAILALSQWIVPVTAT